MVFWKKGTSSLKRSLPQPEKCWTLRVIFWKKVALYTRKVDFYAWFSEKCGFQPETCGPLCISFWKKSGPLSEKCRRFTHDFLKNVDLNTWGFVKSAPQLEKYVPFLFLKKRGTWPEKCCPLHVIWKIWTWGWIMQIITCDFMKKWVSTWKMLTPTFQACAWIIKKFFMM